MNKNLKYRKDNKHLLLWAYFVFLVLIIANLTINIMNTKNVFNMYILFAVNGAFILLYSLFYLIYIKKNKTIYYYLMMRI